MLKADLRTKYKALRKTLTFDEIMNNSLAIANNCLYLPIWEKTYFHLFLPIEAQKEVNTEFLLQILAGRDKEVVVSKSDFDTGSMTHYLLTDNTKLKVNDYGIPEGHRIGSLNVRIVKTFDMTRFYRQSQILLHLRHDSVGVSIRIYNLELF